MNKGNKSKAETETALVAGLIANTREAWRTLLTDYVSAIRSAARRVVRRMARHLPNDFAEDIQQQVLINLLQNDKQALRSFDPSLGSLRTYLSRIAANLAHDQMERALRGGSPLDIDEVLASEARDPAEHDTDAEANDVPPTIDYGYWVGARRAMKAARKASVQS